MELIDTPANRCPPGANIVGLRASDGVELRAAYWRPEGFPRGTVALVQGRAEFIEKYFETIGELLARGFAVATFDWRGQGLSQRLLRNRAKGHVRRSTDYRRDLDAFIRQLLTPDCPKPWFVLAHSMGAAAVLDFCAARGGATPFERIVGTAPMIDLYGFPGSTTARHLAASFHALGLSRLFVPGGGARTLFQKSFSGNVLTGDQRRFARAAQLLGLAPALGIGDPTIGWAHAAYGLMDRLTLDNEVERIRTPTLLLASGDERLVSTPAIERFALRLKTASCLVLSDARHEILMERAEIRSKFWAAFDAFIPGERFLHEAAEAASPNAINLAAEAASSNANNLAAEAASQDAKESAVHAASQNEISQAVESGSQVGV
ncbi:alpha/beta hydrolase [Rhodoblastus acidophilus]|uniref:Alpha/beta hydrolase n=1 Tax=Candidatus Rhodoblastus alkanivorans TaxID=2954117 RepID=A0ABS9Z4D2_9HYPH|nr:alpha/beta hydrolase [Candidatus Rhodoblastus alkanivorans]MCI4679224.1 alpha/beta hydrolase [Candidatus Rhodoblastus alkanivorans]MCI4682452.1 alpha/beta hydrolase [Candidatus Rhodoblastus alkanivorans]MDI4639758.1 alpha/beta hydrolase [Rhodoblastus acidophilus]